MISDTSSSWVESEFSSVKFSDIRLEKRFKKIMKNFYEKPSASIAQTFGGDFHQAKGAYRFFDNDSVDIEEVISIEREKTLERIDGNEVVFAIQDTMYTSYNHHPKKKGLGKLTSGSFSDIKGVILHNTLAVSQSGVPLGLLDQKIYCRKEQTTNHKLLPIEKKESYRWIEPLDKVTAKRSNIVMMCDREADIHEFFEECNNLEISFLNRIQKNRILLNENGKKEGLCLVDFIRESKEKTVVSVTIPRTKNRPERETCLGIHFEKVNLRAPQRQGDKRGNTVEVTVLRAIEKKKPEKEDKLEWILVTNIDIKNAADAAQKVLWYKNRWHVENYHKTIKSLCKIEDCRLEDVENLKKFIILKSLVAYRLYYLTHIGRVHGNMPCTLIFEDYEWKALYLKIKKTKTLPKKPLTLDQAMRMVGQLGGYLNRKSDPPPGVIVLGRGLERLNDLSLGYQLFMGNR